MLLGIKWYHFISIYEPTMKLDARPTNLYSRKLSSMASNPIRAYRPNGRKCRCKADPDFLAFCVLEEIPGRPQLTWMKTVQNDLDSDGLSWTDTVDLAQNRPLWRLLATLSDAMHS